MPEIIGNTIHIPSSNVEFAEIKTIVLSEEKGISALVGRQESSDTWQIKTYLFDTLKGWTMETAQKWADDHQKNDNAQQITQAVQAIENSPTFEDPPDASKYISVRQHPPQHFSGYKHVEYAKTPAFNADVEDKAGVQGIWAALGIWEKTGAKVIQKLHFERALGWTEEKVKEWFQSHPQHHYPNSEGLFFALSDNSAEQMAIVSDHFLATQYVSEGLSEDISELDVIVIQGGWGKNKRRGPGGQMHQDYFTQEFLESMLPLLEQSAVQSVKLTPDAPGAMADIIQEVVAELRQHGHPDDVANLLFRHGFAGNTIGFLTQPVLQGLENKYKYPYIMARFVLSDNEAAQDSKRLLQSAWRHGLDRALGLSINYRATVSFENIMGRPVCVFQHATHHISTELVPCPAAGGKILRPTTVPVGGVVQGEDTMADEKKSTQVELPVEGSDGTKDTAPAEPSAPAGDVVATQSVAANPAPVAVPAQPEPQLQPDLDSIKQMIGSLGETVGGLASTVQSITEQQKKNNLVALVTQSEGLTDASKTQILAQIAGGTLKSADQVSAIVAVAQANVPEQQEQPAAPLFNGMAVQNATRSEITRDRKDVMKIRSYLMWGLPLTQSEQALADKYRIKKFLGMKDEYIQMTGDYELNFRGLNPQTFIQNAHPDVVNHTSHYRGLTEELGVDNYAQTILTTTYSDFLTHILNRTLEIHFLRQDKSYEKVLRKGESYSDNRDHTHFLLGAFPEIDTVAQGASYTEMGSGKLDRVTSSSTKRGNLWKITEESVQDDDLEYVKNAVLQIAIAANRTLEHQVWNYLFGASGGTFNGDTMTDTIAGALYSYTNRRNYINGTVDDYEKVIELINLMLTQTDLMDDDGATAPMTMIPNIFVANVQNIGKIRAAAKTPTEPGRTDMLLNQFYYLSNLPDENFVGVHPQYMLDHPEFLGVLPNPQMMPGLVLSHFRGMETPELIWEGNQQPAYGSAFASDTLQLRVKFKYRLFYYKLKAIHGLFLSA